MISEMQFLLNDVLKQKGVLRFSKLPIKHKYLFMSENTYKQVIEWATVQAKTNPLWINPRQITDEYIYGLKIVIAELPDMKFVLGTEGM